MDYKTLFQKKCRFVFDDWRTPLVFLFCNLFFLSCYTTNEFAGTNRQTAGMLKDVISRADTIRAYNSEKLGDAYINTSTGKTLKYAVDSIKQNAVTSLAHIDLLTKERVNHREWKRIATLTPEWRRNAENSNYHLAVVEQLVTTIHALVNIPATGGQTGAVLKETMKKVDDINTATDVKLKNNTLDPGSASSIKAFTDTIKDQTIRHMREDSVLNNMPNKHKHADDLTSRTRRLAAAAQKNLDDVKVVDELLKTNTFTLVNAGVLFGPGKFDFTPDKMPAVETTFGPAMNTIFSFVNKFPGKKLDVYLVILGYSDASNITASSALGKILIDSMHVQSAESNALNKELSRLRASSVAAFFQSKANANPIKGILYRYLPQGRGEELPDSSIRNYTVSDVRRRVVKLYWTVLPAE